MPYKSDAQRRFMHARHPGIAARWDAEIRAGKKHRVSKANPVITRRRIQREEGRKVTRRKNRKIWAAGQVGSAAGVAAPIALAVGGRGVSAVRGARYASAPLKSYKYIGRPSAAAQRQRTRLGAKYGALYGANRRLEAATLNPATIGLSGFTAQQYAQNRATRKHYPGYKREFWTGGLKPTGEKVKKNMTTVSVWGIDHGEEIGKIFKPILGAKPNPQVAQGLRMVQSMPKPMGVPKPPTQPGLQRAAGVQRFGNSQTGALANRLKGRARFGGQR